MDLENYSKKLVGDEEQRAVSPVIGVILMVAITVILAAVIAAFVLDLGQGQSANPQAGFQINEVNDTSSEVTINNIQRLDSVRYECGSSTFATIDDPSVGDTRTIGNSSTSCTGDSISIIGTYDGTESVMN